MQHNYNHDIKTAILMFCNLYFADDNKDKIYYYEKRFISTHC